jgi:hypothetical protein
MKRHRSGGFLRQRSGHFRPDGFTPAFDQAGVEAAVKQSFRHGPPEARHNIKERETFASA